MVIARRQRGELLGRESRECGRSQPCAVRSPLTSTDDFGHDLGKLVAPGRRLRSFKKEEYALVRKTRRDSIGFAFVRGIRVPETLGFPSSRQPLPSSVEIRSNRGE